MRRRDFIKSDCWLDCGVVDRGARAAAGNAGDRIYQQPDAGRFREFRCRIPPRSFRNGLCRRSERVDRNEPRVCSRDRFAKGFSVCSIVLLPLDVGLHVGFEVAQSSVAKYMVKRSWPPSQGWRTFLRNHSPDIAAMDLFVVPTIGFDLLYVFVIVRLARRDLVWINVTTHPTADWIARQITEAFPWNEAPRYLIRDRD